MRASHIATPIHYVFTFGGYGDYPIARKFDKRTIEETIELLCDAHAIVDGIPIERLDLSSFQSDWSDDGRGYARATREIHCGTMCCAAGWLALHPMFRRRGLTTSSGGEPQLTRSYDHYVPVFQTLADFFGLTTQEAEYLFGSSSDNTEDVPSIEKSMQDKRYFESLHPDYKDVIFEDGFLPTKYDKGLWLWRCKNLVNLYRARLAAGTVEPKTEASK
jgi:hypothetical protein